MITRDVTDQAGAMGPGIVCLPWVVMHTMTATAPAQSRYWDDVTGEPVDLGELMKARESDIAYFEHMQVHRKVLSQEA